MRSGCVDRMLVQSCCRAEARGHDAPGLDGFVWSEETE